MKTTPFVALAASLLATPAIAQEASPAEAVTFAPPVLVQAGNGPMRVTRQAGPHHVDFDQDGTFDMLLGDVMGWVFIARGQNDGSVAAYEDPVRVRTVDGSALKFSNW